MSTKLISIATIIESNFSTFILKHPQKGGVAQHLMAFKDKEKVPVDLVVYLTGEL